MNYRIYSFLENNKKYVELKIGKSHWLLPDNDDNNVYVKNLHIWTCVAISPIIGHEYIYVCMDIIYTGLGSNALLIMPEKVKNIIILLPCSTIIGN